MSRITKKPVRIEAEGTGDFETYEIPAGVIFALQTERPELMDLYISQFEQNGEPWSIHTTCEVLRLLRDTLKDLRIARGHQDFAESRLDDLVHRMRDIEGEIQDALSDASSDPDEDLTPF